MGIRSWLCLVPLGLALALPAQGLRLDEAAIRRCMRAEIVGRVRALAEGLPTTRDFHSLRAWAAVRPRIEPARRAGAAVAAELWRLAAEPAGDEATTAFQEAIDEFARGMTIEILDSLGFEYDEGAALLGRMLKLEELLDELGERAADPALLRRQMARRGIPARLPGRLRRLQERWREAAADAPALARFAALKRSLCGDSPEEGLEVLFALGEAHRATAPFIDDFVAQYGRLCTRVREAATRLRPRLERALDVIQ